MHLDPSTPLGVLDTLGHLAPLVGAATGSGVLLTLGRLFDHIRKGGSQ